MARHKSPGLSYFPKDTDMHADRKIRRLINEFGAKGFLIYDYLLCVVYADKGYYVQYTDDLNFDIADAVKAGINDNLVKEVIHGCIRFGLINENLFNTFSIITSYGIQKRYVSAKKNGTIDPKYGINVEEIAKNDDEIPQSKVKESKEKKIKVKKEAFAQTLEPFLAVYGRDMLNNFFRYWAEANENSALLKWELEDTWEIGLRLKTWANRQAKMDKGMNNAQTDDPATKKIQDTLKRQTGEI